MKLIVNTVALVPPLTGIGHYTANLMDYLLRHGELEDIRGVSGSATHWLDRPAIEQLLQNPASASAQVSPPGLLSRLRHKAWRAFVAVARHVPGARRARRLLFSATAQRQSPHFAGYLYWEPNYIALPLDNPSVVTVYDLSHIAHPEFHPAERVAAMTRDVEASVQRAQRIITISEFTRGEIMREYGVPADRIDIVPPAVGDEFRQPATTDHIDAVRKKHSLPANYLLSVGTLEPRKNVEGLLKAYLRLPDALRKQYPLVLVGVKGWLTGALEQQLAPLVAAGEVRQLGYVDQPDMAVLYQQASALAYVSFYEGYGMPVAEAMAAGTAVLTSGCTSMPEVAQGAALLADPHDVDDVASKLEQLLSDEKLRDQMQEQGRQIAADYTWQCSGEKLLAVLRAL